MKQSRSVRRVASGASAAISVVLGSTIFAAAQTVSVTPSTMPRVGTIDERYQSYNVEMLEVTGGKFWKPYGPALETALQQPAPASSGVDTPAGMNPALYEYRPPIDLTNTRLRKLAAALGPAYVRVSGTWANTTYFPAADEAPANPPAGFGSVLTHRQWQGVIEFAKAVDARIVTSFAKGVGARDATGVWTSRQAKRFLDYTASHGGSIAAAEFMNEPNMAAMGGAPTGYDAAAYGRDFKAFHAFAKQAAPDMQILGPGSVGEAIGDWAVASGYGAAELLKTRDLLTASRPDHVDAFSYHHYGAASRRCAAQGHQTTREAALTEDWLSRTDQTLAFYRKLRDEFEPGDPFWLTETADAACGGDPWASTFLDSFRYLDQLGRLAKQDVRVVIHNTLVASDYGLLDDHTLEPKPNYWAALLWRRLMGSTVLESGVPIRQGLHLYAHCLRGRPGGIALLAINNSRTRPISIVLPNGGDRYMLSARDLEATQAQLNGDPLTLSECDELPVLKPIRVPAGVVELQPASITFLAVSMADNASCR
jgi:heparanase